MKKRLGPAANQFIQQTCKINVMLALIVVLKSRLGLLGLRQFCIGSVDLFSVISAMILFTALYRRLHNSHTSFITLPL